MRWTAKWVLFATCFACGGATQFSSGATPVVLTHTDSGTDASTSEGDAGVDGPFRDIEISAFYLGQAGEDGGSAAVLARPNDVRAQWRWRDGGWGLSQGTLEGDGGFRIRNVPTGEALVFFPTLGGALVTTESRFDFSRVVQGRLDVAIANSAIATSLRVEISNATPWQNGDSTSYFARETPFVRYEQPTLPAGATGLTATIDWHRTGYPLPRGALGDSFGFFQFRPRRGGPLSYRSIIAGGTVPAPDVTDGSSSTVRIRLAERPAVGVQVRLDFPSYERALKEHRPSVPIVLSGFAVTYRRGHSRVGVVTYGYRLMEAGLIVASALGLPPGQPLADDWVEWADVVPREDLVASVITRSDLVVSNGVVSDTFHLVYERSVPVGSNPISLDVTLSPVRDISLNGRRAVGTLNGVGVTPVVSWSPPSRGTATRYRVFIYDLADRSFGVAFYTTKTQLQIPPLVLSPGRSYVAEVMAERGAYDLLRPSFTPADMERVPAMTDAFSP